MLQLMGWLIIFNATLVLNINLCKINIMLSLYLKCVDDLLVLNLNWKPIKNIMLFCLLTDYYYCGIYEWLYIYWWSSLNFLFFSNLDWLPATPAQEDITTVQQVLQEMMHQEAVIKVNIKKTNNWMLKIDCALYFI